MCLKRGQRNLSLGLLTRRPRRFKLKLLFQAATAIRSSMSCTSSLVLSKLKIIFTSLSKFFNLNELYIILITYIVHFAIHCAFCDTLCILQYIVHFAIHCVFCDTLCILRYIVHFAIHCVFCNTLCILRYIVYFAIHCVFCDTLCIL